MSKEILSDAIPGVYFTFLQCIFDFRMSFSMVSQCTHNDIIYSKKRLFKNCIVKYKVIIVYNNKYRTFTKYI